MEKKTIKPPIHARIRFITRFFGKTILKSVQPGNTRKVKTLPIWEVSEGNYKLDIIEDFLAQQNHLKSYIERNKGLIVQNPVIYSLIDALAIIIAHEKRHFKQAEFVIRCY